MQNRDLLQHKPFNNSVFNSAFQALITNKYIFITSVVCCLIAAFLYQTNTVTGYDVSTVLEVTNKGRSKQAAESLAKQIEKYTLPKSLQVSVKQVDRLNIVPGPKPTAVIIKIEDQSQLQAQILLGELIAHYKQQLATEEHVLVVDSQLVGSEVSRLSGKLAALQKQGQPANSLPIKVSRGLVSSKQKEDNERRAKILEIVLSYINKPVNSFVVIPENFVAFDSDLQDRVIEFNELQASKQSILSNDEPDEKELNKTNQRIIAIVNLIKQYAGRQKDSLNSTFQVSNSSQDKVNNQPVAGDSNPYTRGEIKALQDSIKVLQANVAAVPGRSKWEIIQRASEVKPIHPKSSLPYLSAILVGMLVPASAIFVVQKVSKKINKLSDIDSLTSIQVAGMLEDATPAPADIISVQSNPSFTRLSEFLTSRLNRVQNTVWITSGTSDEGKRYFTTGLAQELAHAGNRVMVIDYSLESPDLLDELELSYNIGLQEYLSRDDVSMRDMITASANHNNLHFIGAGVAREQLKMEMLSMLSQLEMPMVSEESKDLTGSKVYEKFGSLLGNLKKQYDYILIAGPATEENIDPFKLATLADLSVIMVRLKYTYKAQLKQLNDHVNAGELVNPFIVINNLRKLSDNSSQAEQDD